MELKGKDLVCYSNKIKAVYLSKRLHDHYLINKAYLGDMTATNINKSFTHNMAAKKADIDMERNYVTVTLAYVLGCG